MAPFFQQLLHVRFSIKKQMIGAATVRLLVSFGCVCAETVCVGARLQQQ